MYPRVHEKGLAAKNGDDPQARRDWPNVAETTALLAARAAVDVDPNARDRLAELRHGLDKTPPAVGSTDGGAVEGVC